MAKEESGRKFPPLLMHLGIRITREDEEKKRRKEGKKPEKEGRKKREKKRNEEEGREIFPTFRWSKLDGPRIKAGPRMGTKIWELCQTPRGKEFSYSSYFYPKGHLMAWVFFGALTNCGIQSRDFGTEYWKFFGLLL